MNVIVRLAGMTEQEEAGAAARLREFNSSPGGAEVPQFATIEEAYADSLARELSAYARRAEEERVTALRVVGEIMVQLPTEVQNGLVGQLIAAAQQHNVDITKLLPPAP